jgi:hypothetical protein
MLREHRISSGIINLILTCDFRVIKVVNKQNINIRAFNSVCNLRIIKFCTHSAPLFSAQFVSSKS